MWILIINGRLDHLKFFYLCHIIGHDLCRIIPLFTSIVEISTTFALHEALCYHDESVYAVPGMPPLRRYQGLQQRHG